MAREYVDIETDGLLGEMSKVHCISIGDIDSEEVKLYHDYPYDDRDGTIADGLERLSRATLIAGHNCIDFDLPAIRDFLGWKPVSEVYDTLVSARLIYPDIKDKDFELWRRGKLPPKLIGSHSLKAWGYRVGEHKGEYEDGWEKYTPKMGEYNKQDVKTGIKVFKLQEKQEYSPMALELEHQVAQIIHEQTRRGFRFDVEKASSLYAQLSAKRQAITQQLQQIFPGWWEEMKTPEYWEWNGIRAPTKAALVRKALEVSEPDVKKSQIISDAEPGPNKRRHTAFNPSSRDHIAQALKEKYGWKPSEYTEKGKPVVDEDVLEKLPYEEAKIMAEYFMIDKRIGMLAEGDQAWLKCERKGKIHGSVITNGAVTGRATHNRPNVAQVPSCDKPYGPECRDLFTCSVGNVLVGMDAAALELRCLAHYLGHWDGGEYAKAVCDGDIHSINQLAAGLPTRNAAKTFIYAWLYGAGPEKIGSIIGKGASEGRVLIDNFLQKLPAIAKLKKAVDQGCRKGWLRGLDGRKLHVRSKHAALNTLLQSAGALVCKKWLVELNRLIKEAGLEAYQVAWIHDELQFDCKPEHALRLGELGEEAMRLTERFFGFKCPLTIKNKDTGRYCNVGSSWKYTH